MSGSRQNGIKQRPTHVREPVCKPPARSQPAARVREPAKGGRGSDSIFLFPWIPAWTPQLLVEPRPETELVTPIDKISQFSDCNHERQFEFLRVRASRQFVSNY